MKLHLNILSPAQRKLWDLLKDIPRNFILYGGTAIALQLGHRESVDFDFFSEATLNKALLLESFSLLAQYPNIQPEINTLNCFVEVDGEPVKIQFLAGLGERQKRINDPVVAEDNQLQIASLPDLFGTKLNTIQHRAECKDYIDIDAMIQSGITLANGLSYAKQIYGKNFDPATSLRALCSYRDGDLDELSQDVQQRLIAAAKAVDYIP